MDCLKIKSSNMDGTAMPVKTVFCRRFFGFFAVVFYFLRGGLPYLIKNGTSFPSSLSDGTSNT